MYPTVLCLCPVIDFIVWSKDCTFASKLGNAPKTAKAKRPFTSPQTYLKHISPNDHRVDDTPTYIPRVLKS